MDNTNEIEMFSSEEMLSPFEAIKERRWRSWVVELTQVGTTHGLPEVLELWAVDGQGILFPAAREGLRPKGAHGGDRGDGAIE